MTALIVCAILLAIICLVEFYSVAVRYEKLKQKTTMRQIFRQDMCSLLKWMAGNWFKLAIVILFIIFIFVLYAGLGNIESSLSDIDSSLDSIKWRL